jgi:hypothetical protein
MCFSISQLLRHIVVKIIFLHQQAVSNFPAQIKTHSDPSYSFLSLHLSFRPSLQTAHHREHAVHHAQEQQHCCGGSQARGRGPRKDVDLEGHQLRLARMPQTQQLQWADRDLHGQH